MTTLRYGGIGRPDELECIIVIAVLLEGLATHSCGHFAHAAIEPKEGADHINVWVAGTFLR
jgi:hypothetical protein